MKLRGFTVDGFGSLSGLSVDALPDGLTVFHGPNEAGKSTLLRFLRQLLFGRWTGRDKRLGDRPIRGGSHGGTLRFETDHGLWMLSRYETKSAINSTLITPDDRRLIGEDGEAQLAALRGHADAALFRSVFSFDLDDLTPLGLLDSDELREAIFSAGVSGAGASAAGALRELEEAVAALLAVRKADAPVNAALDALRNADLRIDEAQRAQSRHAELIGRIEALSAEREALGAEMAALEARRQALRQWAPLRELIDRHRAALTELRSIRLSPALELLHSDAAALAAELSAFQERRRRAADLAESIRGLQLRLETLSEPTDSESGTGLWLGVAVAAAGLLGAVPLLWLGLTTHRVAVTVAAVLAGGIGVSATLWARQRMLRDSAAQANRWQAQTALRELKPRLALEQEALRTLQQELETWRQRASNALQRSERQVTLSDEALAAAIGSLAQDAAQSVQQRLRRQQQADQADTLASQLAQRAEQTSDPDAAIAAAEGGDPAAWEREEHELAARARDLQLRLDASLRDLTLRQSEREALERSADIAEISLQRAAAGAQLQHAVHEWLALRLAARLIETTLHAYQAEHQPAVLARASDALSRLTAGRWTRVLAETGGELMVEGAAGRIKPDELSRGAREQLYLALRFSLAQQFVVRGQALPLIVDDILVNFDPARQEAAAELLGAVSRQQQLLFFTCHPEVVERLRRTVPDLRVVDI